MTLLGDWNWWMPPFLDWIPRVTIEGDPDEPVEAGAAGRGRLDDPAGPAGQGEPLAIRS